ncbi:MAG: hypothetical protein LBE06_02290 [Azoarcus sp.]|jgi:hypothetical protein|nr:hypothetical protein [Azoarcus sp.]
MMKRWEGAIHRNNHIKTGCYHIIIAMMLCGVPAFTPYTLAVLHASPLFFLFLLPFLAIGCWFKLELARKIPEFAFVAMAVGFPFCSYMVAPVALLAMFLFLPATIWKDPNGKDPDAGHAIGA